MKHLQNFISESKTDDKKGMNCFLLATYYFNSDDKENCYSHPDGDEHHITLVIKVKNIIDDHISDKDTVYSNISLISNGYKSSLEVGYEWNPYKIKNPFEDIDKLIDELKDLHKENSFIEYKADKTYKTK